MNLLQRALYHERVSKGALLSCVSPAKSNSFIPMKALMIEGDVKVDLEEFASFLAPPNAQRAAL